MSDDPRPGASNPLADFVARLRAQRAALDAQDWTPPEPPDHGPIYNDFRLKPLQSSSLVAFDKPLALEQLRNTLAVKIHDYLDGPSEATLIIKTAPGTGKTYAAVGAAQIVAGQGQRGLWCASRHNMFDDLARFEHFRPRLWHHWKGIQGEADGEPVCRHAAGQKHWSELGYAPMKLCEQLCGRFRDNHIRECPYRLQARRKEPLIFGQHQHLTAGLAVSDFDFVVVDELPLSAFVEQRLIPLAGLEVGAIGPLNDLVRALAEICAGAPPSGRVSGKALLDDIGDILTDVYAQVEVSENVIPDVPLVWDENMVFRAPYWYLFDLLLLLGAEHRAWREKWPGWNAQVWCTRKGLHLLTRATLWEKLPPKIVVLDATAQPDLYGLLFGGEIEGRWTPRVVEVFAPRLARQGKIYQVAGRQNGRVQTTQGKDLTRSGKEMLEVACHLAQGAVRPGVICWKSFAPHFRRRWQEQHDASLVLTFGALRGTNALQDCDVLIVAGAFQPDGSDMLDLAATLSRQVRPFWEVDEAGKRQPVYKFEDREYRLSDEGLRMIRDQYGQRTRGVARRVGYYAHPTLDAIHRQLRESELLQALHRVRLVQRDATVWLLTSIPLQEEAIDGVWDNPPLGGPPGIHWRVWLKLEPWLERQWQRGNVITYQDLADAAEVQINWARKQQWLDKIADHLSTKWQVSQILEPVGRGRPKKNLIPLSGKGNK